MDRSVGTHDGRFHADEVTAIALLLLFGYVDRDKIIRTRDPLQLEKCEFICDVGGEYDPKKKRFDHHQSTYQGALSSAGMVWLYLKEQGKVSDEMYDHFQRVLIRSVDAQDQGYAPKENWLATFSSVVANFMPAKYDTSKETVNRAFLEAIDFVFGHLTRLCAQWNYVQESRMKVKQVMASSDQWMVFDVPMPWMEAFFAEGGERHPALYVIMPAGDHWKLRCIPPSLNEPMKMRRALPESWAGLSDRNLQSVTHIPGAIFCHKGRFISIWATKEDAIKAVESL